MPFDIDNLLEKFSPNGTAQFNACSQYYISNTQMEEAFHVLSKNFVYMFSDSLSHNIISKVALKSYIYLQIGRNYSYTLLALNNYKSYMSFLVS